MGKREGGVMDKLKNFSTEQLQEEIERRAKAAILLPLLSADEVKIEVFRDKFFDTVYGCIQEAIEQMSREERVKDFEHCVFEVALSAAAEVNQIPDTEFWSKYSKISQGYDE